MRRLRLICALLPALLWTAATTPARAQSLDEQLDQEQFLRGLAEFGLHDLLEYVRETGGGADGAMPHLIAIAQLQASLADEQRTPADRSRAIDDLIAARRRLVEAFPADPRLPLWQADLALGLLFLAHAEGAAALTAEFGVADEAQREALAAAAREALQLVDDATVALADEILDLEEHPDFAGSASMQQRHRRLLHVEQRQRLPFLHACAAHLAAAVDDSGGSEDQWRVVAETLTPLLGELAEPWLSRARSLIGVAQTRLGRFDEARRQFDAVIAAPQADAIARLRARFGAVQLLARGEGRVAASAAIDRLISIDQIRRDPFAYLLACDLRFRLIADEIVGGSGGPRAWRAAQGEAAQRLVAEAVRLYRFYLQNDFLPLNAAQREDVVAGRWRIIAPESIALADLPPEMALAQAERLTAEPQQQAQAMALLEDLLSRHGQSEELAPRLLMALGNLHAQRGEVEAACARWLDLARRFAADARAPLAAERAAATLSATLAGEAASAGLEALYEQALTLILDRFPQAPGFDRWAYERGLLLAGRGRFDEAADSFAQVGPDSALRVDAAFQVAGVRWKQASATEGSDRRAMLVEAKSAAERVLELIDRAAPAAALDPRRAADLRYYRAAAQVRAAQAQRDLGEHEAALARLAGLEDQDGVEESLAAEIIDTRISILEATGQTEQIERDLRELADRSPQRALGFIARIGAARAAEAQRLLDAGKADEAKAMAEQRIEPLTRLGHSIAQPLSDSGETGLAAALSHADALRLAERRSEALGVYESVLVWRENSAEAILGRSECLYAMQRWAEALPGFQRLAAARAEARDAVFWLAELRILQIFDAAQRNTDRIGPRVGRLRLIDPELGGPRLRREFAVLEDRYAP